MAYVEKFVDFLSQFELGIRYLEIVSNLSQVQIEIIIIITLMLFTFIVYRFFGAAIFWVFLFVLFIGYIIYRANIGDFYKERNAIYDQRMQEIQAELDKDINTD